MTAPKVAYPTPEEELRQVASEVPITRINKKDREWIANLQGTGYHGTAYRSRETGRVIIVCHSSPTPCPRIVREFIRSENVMHPKQWKAA